MKRFTVLLLTALVFSACTLPSLKPGASTPFTDTSATGPAPSLAPKTPPPLIDDEGLVHDRYYKKQDGQMVMRIDGDNYPMTEDAVLEDSSIAHPDGTQTFPDDSKFIIKEGWTINPDGSYTVPNSTPRSGTEVETETETETSPQATPFSE